MRRLLICLCIAVSVLAPGRASAREPLYLLLARVCVGEAGFDSTLDCEAIWAVITRRARRLGITERAMLHAYAGKHLDKTRLDSRAWVAHLRLDGRRPRFWPRNLDWEDFRHRWAYILGFARLLVLGIYRPHCEPDHWGAPYGIDLERAKRAGWYRVDCGETLNYFWSIRPPEPTL